MEVFKLASKIKIKIVDKNSNFKLWIPSIPFWLITFLSHITLKFKNIAIRDVDYPDDDIKFFLKQLDNKMIKNVIYELKSYGKFDLVDISTGDGTIVKISIG
ncbi:hypothetical protein [Tissierella sp.]|uniref:hypothetical protein n=1 Tax=Tissierella sp. TaxID=41274 RepID=UPI0028A7F310|nr:hypothetical protein [Tissierella sp.]